MDIQPQYTYDKHGNPIGVFISIEEWTEIENQLNVGLPQWQKDALDVELAAIEKEPQSSIKWEEARKQFGIR